MTKNIGTKDRLIRLAIAIACFVGAYVARVAVFQLLLVAFGLFCVFQATFSWCAWYALLGRNTCPIQK
jgi:hypothetical protein